MKVRKYIKRDREIIGRGTGTIMCRLSLPITDETYDWRSTPTNSARAIKPIRKFVARHLSKSPDLLAGSTFIIEAEIRTSPRTLGRKRLAVWKFGEPLDPIFEKALKEWNLLEMEEDWIPFDTEI